MEKVLNMKKTGAAAVLVVLALWLGYYLGYHNGVRQERGAWLATEQTVPDSTPTVTTGRPAIQTSRWTRTFYRNPYVGGTMFVRSGPAAAGGNAEGRQSRHLQPRHHHLDDDRRAGIQREQLPLRQGVQQWHPGGFKMPFVVGRDGVAVKQCRGCNQRIFANSHLRDRPRQLELRAWLSALFEGASRLPSFMDGSNVNAMRHKSGKAAMTWLLPTLLFVAAMLEAVAAPATTGPGDRPNILWLVSEDNDTFLGCYGDPLAHTPTLDRLASQGVLFERCFAQPVCAPSRFTLITGMYSVTCGPAEHMRAQGKIPSWLKGFPAYLREAGYYTSNNAKTDYNAPINMKEAWDESSKNAHWRKRPDPKQPFFSVFNHEVTHESCLFPVEESKLDFPPMDPARVRIPPYQPDTPEMRADWARYYNHMTLMDGQIAAKLKQLEQDGLAENTIVFYYSRQRRRAAAQQAVPSAQRHACAADRLFPAQVAAPGAGSARLAHQGPGELRGLCADRALAGRGEDSRLHDGPRLCRSGQGPAERVLSSARATAWTSATT